MPLSHWDTVVQSLWRDRMTNTTGEGSIPAASIPNRLWDEWLWGTDPHEPMHRKCCMNRNTLTGFLIARYRAAKQQRFHTSQSTLSMLCKDGSPDTTNATNITNATNATNATNHMDEIQKNILDVHHTTPVNMYTLKQLRDTVQNMQRVWTPHSCVEMPGITEAVDACMHRFGVLASMPHCGIIMDDQGNTH